MMGSIKAMARQQLLAKSPINSNNDDDDEEEEEDIYYPSRHIEVIHECIRQKEGLDLVQDHHGSDDDDDRRIISEMGHAYQSKFTS